MAPPFLPDRASEPLPPRGPARIPFAQTWQPPQERMKYALDVARAAQTGESKAFALQCAALAEVMAAAAVEDRNVGHDDATDMLPGEVAGTLTRYFSTAAGDLAEAEHLLTNLPGTYAALDDGWLPRPQAQVVIEETFGLNAEQCAAIEARVLGWIDGQLTGSVRRRVRKLRKDMEDAREAEERRKQAVEARGVLSFPLEDGMAEVRATMPAGAERLFRQDLAALAQLAEHDADARTAAQREADVLAALPGMVLSMASGGFGEDVQRIVARHGFTVGGRYRPLETVVLVPLATALGDSNECAELRGHGPISAEHARSLLPTSTVRLAALDEHGRIAGLSTETLRPDSRALSATGRCLTAESLDLDDSQVDESTGEVVAGVLAAATERVRNWLREKSAQPVPAPDSEPGYVPSAHLRRFLTLRDPQCIGLGSAVSARRCDAEHRIPWPDGATSPDNLAPVSRRWHRAKQRDWRYSREPDGTTIWRSPLGRVYRRPGWTWAS